MSTLRFDFEARRTSTRSDRGKHIALFQTNGQLPCTVHMMVGSDEDAVPSIALWRDACVANNASTREIESHDLTLDDFDSTSLPSAHRRRSS